jgi:hypothetical protein
MVLMRQPLSEICVVPHPQPKGIGHGAARPRTEGRRINLRRRVISNAPLDHSHDELARNPLAGGLHLDLVAAGLCGLVVGLVGRKDAPRSVCHGPQDYTPAVRQARRTGHQLSGLHQIVAQVDRTFVERVEADLSARMPQGAGDR